MGYELCMKTFFYYVLFFVLVSFSGCGKKNRECEQKKIAHNYFKLAYIELTDHQANAYRYKKALSYLEQALAIIQDARYLALKATLLFKLQQYDESKQIYEQACTICRDPALNAEISNNYACLLAHLGQYEQAIPLFVQLSTDRYYLTPEVALMNLGKIDLEKKSYDTALRYFQRATALAPEYLDAHFYGALTAHLLGDNALAKQGIGTILYMDPDNQAALSLQARLEYV